jgi:hypothetical protein
MMAESTTLLDSRSNGLTAEEVVHPLVQQQESTRVQDAVEEEVDELASDLDAGKEADEGAEESHEKWTALKDRISADEAPSQERRPSDLQPQAAQATPDAVSELGQGSPRQPPTANPATLMKGPTSSSARAVSPPTTCAASPRAHVFEALNRPDLGRRAVVSIEREDADSRMSNRDLLDDADSFLSEHLPEAGLRAMADGEGRNAPEEAEALALDNANPLLGQDLDLDMDMEGASSAVRYASPRVPERRKSPAAPADEPAREAAADGEGETGLLLNQDFDLDDTDWTSMLDMKKAKEEKFTRQEAQTRDHRDAQRAPQAQPQDAAPRVRIASGVAPVINRAKDLLPPETRARLPPSGFDGPDLDALLDLEEELELEGARKPPRAARFAPTAPSRRVEEEEDFSWLDEQDQATGEKEVERDLFGNIIENNRGRHVPTAGRAGPRSNAAPETGATTQRQPRDLFPPKIILPPEEDVEDLDAFDAQQRARARRATTAGPGLDLFGNKISKKAGPGASAPEAVGYLMEDFLGGNRDEKGLPKYLPAAPVAALSFEGEEIRLPRRRRMGGWKVSMLQIFCSLRIAD